MTRIAITTTIAALLLTLSVNCQSTYGYLGKRVYLSGDLSAGPSILGKNTDGKRTLVFNVTGTGSFNIVLNKKNVFDINYKRYSDVAGIRDLDGSYISVIPGETITEELGYYRFRTNEFGFSYKFFFKNLDAPLGGYASIGLGLAISKLDYSFNILSDRYANNDPYAPPSEIIQFDNGNRIISPVIRFGLGKQTVFGKRFFYNYGIDVGINLGGIAAVIGPTIEELTSTSYYSDNDRYISTQDLEEYTKKSVQKRVFMNQLFNFRMGIGMLIF
ncbi:MAG: hypothetical protein ACPGEG_05275 [Salibacteraceae bacterium]